MATRGPSQNRKKMTSAQKQEQKQKRVQTRVSPVVRQSDDSRGGSGGGAGFMAGGGSSGSSGSSGGAGGSTYEEESMEDVFSKMMTGKRFNELDSDEEKAQEQECYFMNKKFNHGANLAVLSRGMTSDHSNEARSEILSAYIQGHPFGNSWFQDRDTQLIVKALDDEYPGMRAFAKGTIEKESSINENTGCPYSLIEMLEKYKPVDDMNRQYINIGGGRGGGASAL